MNTHKNAQLTRNADRRGPAIIAASAGRSFTFVSSVIADGTRRSSMNAV
jgi:hypothetical protein